MKRPLLCLAMLLPASALYAQTSAEDIRAGRAALVAGQPVQARAQFAAALAHPDLSAEDRYAAAMGLGQATLWLGDYRAAGESYRTALALATDEAGRQAAATGLAQALNAQDRPREALALVAPFAGGQLRATVEVLRALQALGWQERSRPYLDAAPAAPATGYLGTQYRLLHEDMDYALAAKADGSLDFSHDSEGLDIWRAGARFLAAPVRRGDGTLDWGVQADTTAVEDADRRFRVHQAGVSAQWRPDDWQRFDLALGAGRADGWHFMQGDARWSLQPSDGFGLSATAARAVVPTVTALAQRLVGNRYALDVSLRPATHWYLLPGAYRQVFSDGNHRDGGSLRLLLSPYDVPNTTAALGAELSTRLFNDSRPSRGVYFNPARYRATQAGLIGIYSLDPRWKLRLNADAGRQWVNGMGAAIYTLDCSLEGRLPGNGRLLLRAGRSSAASASGGGAGYWNDSASVSVSFPL
jgi:tetratricopeptide (TPR) repeat protein